MESLVHPPKVLCYRCMFILHCVYWSVGVRCVCVTYQWTRVCNNVILCACIWLLLCALYRTYLKIIEVNVQWSKVVKYFLQIRQIKIQYPSYFIAHSQQLHVLLTNMINHACLLLGEGHGNSYEEVHRWSPNKERAADSCQSNTVCWTSGALGTIGKFQRTFLQWGAVIPFLLCGVHKDCDMPYICKH